MAAIREDEWRAEIARLNAQNPDGSTAEEIAAALGIGVKPTLQRIKKLIAEGKARFAGHRRTTRVDTRGNMTPVYLLTPTGRTTSGTAKSRARR